MKETITLYLALFVLFSVTRSAIVKTITAQSISDSLSSTIQIINSQSITPSRLSIMKNVELSTLNQLRALHGCGPVFLNETLNKAAQSYAFNLSQLQNIVHSKGASNGNYGQNIYKTIGSPYVNYKKGYAVMKWYNEIDFYNFETGKTNDPSKTVLHFTAEIWCSVKSVGFGFQGIETSINGKKGAALYVVANFYPTPNIVGKEKQNIPRLLQKK